MELHDIQPRKIKSVQREAEVVIEKYAADGVSLTHDDGKAVFVRFAVPGERMRVNIYRETKDYAIAEPVEILETSPLRIQPECPYFGMCGGCDYQFLPYDEQIRIKEQTIIETFRKIGKLEIEKLTGTIVSPQAYYYRNTETFKVNPKLKKIGFFRRDTKFVVDVDECRIAMAGVNDALASVRTQPMYPMQNFKVRATLDDDVTVNWISTEKYEDKAVYERVDAAGQSLKFKISKDSFFQVNDYVIPAWIEKILSFLDGDETVYDLYCGIGLITLFASFKARETVGVELAKSSVKDANHNVEINGIKNNLRFVLGDAGEALATLPKPDVIIIDPPRKGAGDEVIRLILEYEPKKVIYSSCKPATLARDIHALSEKYRLAETWLVDMFPQTHHIEALNLLVRK